MSFFKNLVGGKIGDAAKEAAEASKTKTIKLIIIAITFSLIFAAVAYIYSKTTLNKTNCKNLSKIYDSFPIISSVSPDQKDYDHVLRDYYIKTAYNCCCGGQYKNDFVDLCALKTAIKQGARCLDFGVYSVGNQPVIAASAVDDFSIKEMYNSIPFQSAMEVIEDYAFSGSTCPNSHDPLILHFRIKSNNKPIYEIMAKNLYNTLERRMLGKKYSYENDGKNLGNVPIKNLMGKVIIIVDKSNPLYEDTALDEYVNMSSNSVFMRALRAHNVIYTHDMQELIEFNKKNMTIVLPDLSSKNTNFSSSLCMKYGCQLVAMAFQNFDANMEYYDLFFDGVGHAFALKPEHLRYIPVTIPQPPPPPQAYSYESRPVKSDYYSFEI